MSQLNLVWVTLTAAPGTAGNFAVGPAKNAAHRSFVAADNGKSVTVRAFQSSGSEVRLGCVYNHATSTLTRGTLEESTAGAGVPIDLTASAEVMAAVAASEIEAYDAAQHAPTDVSASTGFKGYFCRGGKGATSNFTLTAGRHTLVRFDRTIYRRINAVLVRVSTAGAGGTQMQAVVYRFGSGGQPEFPALAVSSLVDASTTGDKVLTLPSDIMPPGVFAVGIQSDGTPVINGFSGVDGDHGWGIGGGFLPISFVHHVGSGLVLPTSWSLVPNTGGATYPGLGVRCVT